MIHPSLLQLTAAQKLKRECDAYSALLTGVEKALQGMHAESKVIQELLAKLHNLAHEYELLLATKPPAGVKFNITGVQTTLTQILNAKVALIDKVDWVTVDRYKRKLRSKYHPDRRGGDAQVFDLIVQAARSGSVEILYTYLVIDDPLSLDFDTYEQMRAGIFRKDAALKTSPAFDIVRSLKVGQRLLAHNLFEQALKSKINHYLSLLMGLGFAKVENVSPSYNDPSPEPRA